MRTRFSSHCLIVVGALLLSQSASAQSTAKLNRKFATKVTVEIEAEPIADFFERMSKEHKVVIDVDKGALADEGIAIDDLISLSLKEVTLFTALKLASESPDLVCIPQGKKLHVTTYTTIREKMYVQQYSFPWLRPLNVGSRSLAEAIERTTIGLWFNLSLEGGEFSAFAPTAFKVSQNWENHQQISQILAELQSIVSGRGQLKRNPNEVRLAKALQTLIELEAGDKPLEMFLSQLLTENEINYWVDTSELSNEGISLTDSVNVTGGKKPIAEHLAESLKFLKLSSFIDGEVVKVTSTLVGEENLAIRVYDVRNQVRKVGSTDSVIQVIENTEGTGKWSNVVQEGGDLRAVGPLLVISQTRQGHNKIAEMLKQ